MSKRERRAMYAMAFGLGVMAYKVFDQQRDVNMLMQAVAHLIYGIQQEEVDEEFRSIIQHLEEDQ